MSIEPEDLNRGIITKTTSEPYDKTVKELSELLQRPNYKEQAEKLARALLEYTPVLANGIDECFMCEVVNGHKKDCPVLLAEELLRGNYNAR